MTDSSGAPEAAVAQSDTHNGNSDDKVAEAERFKGVANEAFKGNT